jgi:tripartite-type tricarboxylate transporter receptor subunit TctC
MTNDSGWKGVSARGRTDSARRRLLAAAAATAGAAFIPMAASRAEAGWPQRTVRIVVPYPPGGTTDLLARSIAPKLSERLKQPVVIENRAGAGGTIGTAAVARSTADGYTLLMGTIATHTLNPVLMKLPYDALNDFEPVTNVADTPNVLVVTASAPYRTLADLLAAARANPGSIMFGSTSPGGSPHMSGELLKALAKVNLTHVPYKGGAPMLADLLGGQITVGFDNLPSSMAHIRSGRLRALAVTSARRTPMAPEIPTVAESGVAGYEVSAWFGLLAPAGTPKPIVAVVQRHVAELLREADVARQLQDLGAVPVGNTSQEFAQMLATELQKWREVVAANSIKID